MRSAIWQRWRIAANSPRHPQACRICAPGLAPHSDAHEVLGVAQGESRVQFGGPQGQVLTVRAGDVVVVPAGVGHCRQSQSDGLVIVGAYPANTATRDLRRGNPAEHDDVVRNIAAVPLPPADPVAGDDGPLLRLWAA